MINLTAAVQRARDNGRELLQPHAARVLKMNRDKDDEGRTKPAEQSSTRYGRQTRNEWLYTFLMSVDDQWHSSSNPTSDRYNMARHFGLRNGEVFARTSDPLDFR